MIATRDGREQNSALDWIAEDGDVPVSQVAADSREATVQAVHEFMEGTVPAVHQFQCDNTVQAVQQSCVDSGPLYYILLLSQAAVAWHYLRTELRTILVTKISSM